MDSLGSRSFLFRDFLQTDVSFASSDRGRNRRPG